jgi:hypothetical protein
MPSDENPKEYRNSKAESADLVLGLVRHSGFGFLSAFVIRHSSFALTMSLSGRPCDPHVLP